MSGKISLATYLFRRLRQNGVTAIYGVPGDFTLRMIDQMKAAGIEWVGTCNELNAGYAADGYARIKGLGAILTTYGVGELSAINAIAGSFAEHVPVVHIAGVPSDDASRSKNIVHHALPDRSTNVFAKMYQEVTATQVHLNTSGSHGRMLIDSSLAIALKYRRPIYMRLPNSTTEQLTKPDRLETPLEHRFGDDQVEQRTEKFAVELVEKLQRARFPLLLVDRGRDMDMARTELNEFVRHSGIPTITMPSGASMIDHDIPNYLGVHSGPVGQINTMPLIEQADLVLAFGPMFSDTQTLGWKTVPDPSKTIQIPNWQFRTEGERMYPINAMNTSRLLTLMTERLWPTSLRLSTSPPSLLQDFPNFRNLPTSEITGMTHPIDQTSFYTRVNPYIKPHDIVLLGNATPILGGRDFVLPSPTCRVISSGLSFSIGHMLPAALGAAVAQQHNDSSQSTSATSYADTHASTRGRVVLFDGDGSFQVTAQELSTIIRLRLNVTIFILNNAGYAYERLIHGLKEDYNDIAEWDYLSLPAAFGGREALRRAAEEGEEYGISCACLRTWADLDAFLEDQRFDNGFDGKAKRGLKLVDVRVGRTDVPSRFKEVFEQAGRNLRESKSAQNEEDEADDNEAGVEVVSNKKSDTKAAKRTTPSKEKNEIRLRGNEKQRRSESGQNPRFKRLDLNRPHEQKQKGQNNMIRASRDHERGKDEKNIPNEDHEQRKDRNRNPEGKDAIPRKEQREVGSALNFDLPAQSQLKIHEGDRSELSKSFRDHSERTSR